MVLMSTAPGVFPAEIERGMAAAVNPGKREMCVLDSLPLPRTNLHSWVSHATPLGLSFFACQSLAPLAMPRFYDAMKRRR